MLGRFRPPAFGWKPNLAHPLCRGLKYLAFFRGRNLVHPLVGPLLNGAASGGTVRFGQYGPELLLTRASSEYVTLGTVGQLGLTGSVTMVARVTAGADPGATEACVVVGWDNDNPSRGAILTVTNYSAISRGPGFYAITPTGSAEAWGSQALGSYPADTNLQFAGVYDADADLIKVYRDGVQKDSDSAIGAFNTATGGVAYVGRRDLTAEDDFLDGAVQWFALFNRALTPAEVWLWSQDDWGFLYEDEALADTGHTFTVTTAVGAGSTGTSGSPSTPDSYTTGVTLGCASGGDVEGDDGSPDDLDAETVVSAGQSYQPGLPELVSHTTRVDAAGAIDLPETLDLETEVEVAAGAPGGAGAPGSGARILIDGRKDILATRHYRR